MNHEKTPGWMARFLEKRKQGKKLGKDQLLIIILSGVLLLVIALPTGKAEKNSKEGTGKDTSLYSGNGFGFGSNSFGGSIGMEENSEDSGEENIASGINALDADAGAYTEEMEKKLEQILGNMDQVGKVRVFLTLQSSGEKVVEKDIPLTRSNTEEQDSGGGNRSINNVDSKETTVYETDSGRSTPYVIKTTSPRVEGVVVVCEGAGVGNVSKNITDAIEVLFGIEPHKIKVVKMKTS